MGERGKWVCFLEAVSSALVAGALLARRVVILSPFTSRSMNVRVHRSQWKRSMRDPGHYNPTAGSSVRQSEYNRGLWFNLREALGYDVWLWLWPGLGQWNGYSWNSGNGGGGRGSAIAGWFLREARRPGIYFYIFFIILENQTGSVGHNVGHRMRVRVTTPIHLTLRFDGNGEPSSYKPNATESAPSHS